ncbi:Stp1/IreP family PP2C-type Ser/Thr phosphatase [Pasteuria penetrans]|uniref:Stp1/IreP family PP2C-type Ser/Thr phosphatase n=1 Tax=Pasteuria penetrans TaxID=86005 RepID=UPI000FA02846|nr:Stp1/IreP family PP2C-type Ser/Thr phosphatase [Pasteuria penetrans]
MEMVQRTDIGHVRSHNEDRTSLTRTACGTILALVADGMGGHQAGELASRYAVETIQGVFVPDTLKVSTDEKRNKLFQSVQAANRKIFELAQGDPNLLDMGTTVLASLVDEHEIVLAHVGDSRAYLLRGERLYRLTVDHTYVEILKQHGQITEEEAKNHPQRHWIVHAVGTKKEDVKVDIVNTPWEEKDILLLCSDGLTAMVEDREIGLFLASRTMTLEEKADSLLQRALDAGGTDNISLILLRHTGASSSDI